MTSCIDCPDLERHPGDIQPRAKCCRDEHIERRLDGDYAPWLGIEVARERSAIDAEAKMSRQQRRAAQRKASKS